MTDWAQYKRRQRVTVQERNLTPAKYNEPRNDYNDANTVWAYVGPSGGHEAEFGAQQVSIAPYLVVMRYYPRMSTTHRIKYRGRTLNIVSVNIPEEYTRFTVLLCREAVGVTA